MFRDNMYRSGSAGPAFVFLNFIFLSCLHVAWRDRNYRSPSIVSGRFCFWGEEISNALVVAGFASGE